jgi:nitrogen fixation-related uncharacterized protein
MDNMTMVVAVSIVIGVAVGFAYWASKNLPDIGEFGDLDSNKKSPQLMQATHVFLMLKIAHLIDPTSSRFPLVKADQETWTWFLMERQYVESVYTSITEMDGQLCQVCVLNDSRGKTFIVADESVRKLYLLMATNCIDVDALRFPQNYGPEKL